MSYEVIVADPPWTYVNRSTESGYKYETGAALHYDLMTDEEIFALPIRDMMAEKSAVFLWATCPKLDTAMRTIENWGLNYRGVAFVWVKTSADGVPWRARGVRPTVVKPLTEMVLVASKGTRGRPLPLHSESVVQTIFKPPRRHSEKPDDVQERLEQMYPDATKLEMFARRQRPGWDVWGELA